MIKNTCCSVSRITSVSTRKRGRSGIFKRWHELIDSKTIWPWFGRRAIRKKFLEVWRWLRDYRRVCFFFLTKLFRLNQRCRGQRATCNWRGVTHSDEPTVKQAPWVQYVPQVWCSGLVSPLVSTGQLLSDSTWRLPSTNTLQTLGNMSCADIIASDQSMQDALIIRPIISRRFTSSHLIFSCLSLHFCNQLQKKMIDRKETVL